jgi:iron complex transport system ATP-binding protein
VVKILRVRKTKPILEISNLCIERGGTVILTDVNWSVQPGEHWVILGANGSGKTSLLSALTGYLMPTTGEISLLGETYGQSDWRELRKQIGLVSSSVRQMMADGEPALETIASGKYAMIDFWGRLSRTDKVEALRLLKQVECGYLAERPWRVLSQGERQRVLLARALMAKPRVLILDEPCAGLDPAAREHFLQFLQRLGARKNSQTLVLVTHHVEEIMPVFSRVLIFKSGRVLAAGRKPDVLNSKKLSAAFGAQMQLRQRKNRYLLTVSTKSHAMM